MNIHSHSIKVFQINLFTKDTDHPMGSGTGFFCEYKEKHFMVSNYHLITGCKPHTGEVIHQSGAIPGRINFDFESVQDLPNGTKKHSFHNSSINLFDKTDKQVWFEHPKYGNKCDVVIIKLSPEFLKQIPSENRLGTIDIQRALKYNAELNVMDSVFITGFPLEKEKTFTRYAIYKFGKIASEPDDHQNGKQYYVDAKTKPGMSGSPVIQKEEGKMIKKENKLQFTKDRINFLGIYSGRAEKPKDEYQAELGIVWPYKEFLLPTLEKYAH